MNVCDSDDLLLRSSYANGKLCKVSRPNFTGIFQSSCMKTVCDWSTTVWGSCLANDNRSQLSPPKKNKVIESSYCTQLIHLVEPRRVRHRQEELSKRLLQMARHGSAAYVVSFVSLQALVVFWIALGYVFTRSCKLNEPSAMLMRKKREIEGETGMQMHRCPWCWGGSKRDVSVFTHISLSNEPQLTGESNLRAAYTE